MTALLAPPPLDDTPPFAHHDLVRVPDGRIGKVIGFYKRRETSVLVSFAVGLSSEFFMTDLERA
jgi:hypothetical protein